MLFGPKVLEEVDSKFSGKIRAMQTFGYNYLATGVLTQSGGLVRDVWEQVLKKYAAKDKTWFILGLAGGTIAGIIAKKFQPKKIIGIEIDPVMIRLGKKYLDLDKITNLEIIIADAKSYLLSHNSYFDYILVDMYLGDKLPDFVYDQKFLRKLGQLGQLIIFNHLFYDDLKRKKAGELVEKLKEIFPSVTLMRKLTNLLIICS